MAVGFINFTKHAVTGATKLLATNGGKHIYNVKATADVDNGAIIGRGAFVSMEYYAEATPTAFAGTIVAQASNGNFYVEVTEADNALLVATVPVIYEEYATQFQHESNFYNAQGDIMRCYELAVGDIFELSKEGFTGTPVVGKTVSVTAKKLAVA